MNKDFFNRKTIEDIDQEIEDHLARPTLVKKIKKSKKRKIEGQLDWQAELEKYWYVYVFLIVSALFTGTLGAYMGLAPYPTPEGLFFQTDLPHLFLAFVYIVAFITVTEVAFALGKRLFFTREENNGVQKWTTLIMMGISGISIFGTGLAGGMVIASNIEFMTAFSVIPEAAQKWVIMIIPALITLYTVLVSAYHLSSESASSERITREQIREQELDNITRMRAIETIATERLAQAEVIRFIQMVEEGRISAADAQAAIRAGRTLGKEEVRQRRDIDGNGSVGNMPPQRRPMPQMAMETQTPIRRDNGRGPDPS